MLYGLLSPPQFGEPHELPEWTFKFFPVCFAAVVLTVLASTKAFVCPPCQIGFVFTTSVSVFWVLRSGMLLGL